MYVEGFLHKTLSPVMHKKRLVTLCAFVSTVLRSKKLSLSSLGREINLPIKDRSGIRRADRFLGNEKLHKERRFIYQSIINHVVGTARHFDIVVDWSNVPNTTHHILRAARVAQGRTITLYEEVHVESELGTADVQRKFLHRLKELLPSDCVPTLITDAGFYNDWFKEILALGWNFVGRIRGIKCFRKEGDGDWQHTRDIATQATDKPRYFGKVEFCRTNSLNVDFYLYKKGASQRARSKKAGRKPTDYRKASKEAWLLATSLPQHEFLAEEIIAKYSARMQIEESFRDLKSSRYGFGFEKAHSKCPARIEVLLLIAMLASFIAWFVGWLAERCGLHRQFQSNSLKKRILSLFFLGCQVIKKAIPIPIDCLETSIIQVSL